MNGSLLSLKKESSLHQQSQNRVNKKINKEASLYIHVPFCTKKCPYCHFFVTKNNALSQKEYLAALFIELERVLSLLEKKKLLSIYFGGGTPSLLSPLDIEIILKKINPQNPCEITLEINPGDVTKDTLQNFKKAGINRVSIGVQSFDDQLLKILGREHSAKEAINCIESAFEIGFSNITIDLLSEIPTQTLSQFENSLIRASSLPITHLSLYNLTFEEGTAFFRKKKSLLPLVASDEEAVSMTEKASEILKQNGLNRYEISAFAKEGYEAIHNSGYWKGRDFLGIGPSAFSYLNKRRFQNVCNLKEYCNKMQNGQSAINFKEELPYPHNICELFAIRLRLFSGINIKQFEKEHGNLPDFIFPVIEKYKEKGWLKGEMKISLTEKGALFYDTIASDLLP